MNRVPSLALRVAVAAMFLFSGLSRMKAQEPASAPAKQEAPKQDTAKQPAKVPGRDQATGRFTPAPRRVPIGFAPGQTATQIEIAR